MPRSLKHCHLAITIGLIACAGHAFAQAPAAPAMAAQAPAAEAMPPAAVDRVTFDQAVQRAIERNPSSAIAAAGILRAEALLQESQADTRLQVNGAVTTTTLNKGVKFQDTTVSPQNQMTGSLDVRMPLYAPARWARRAQAQDSRDIADLSAANVRRQVALAAADAYLTVIARRRAIETNERARDTARAHFDLARELQERGTGSRLNQLRAQQQLSSDEAVVEAVRLALYRAQEALGVLLLVDGPVDATDDPVFTIPAAPDAAAHPTVEPPQMSLTAADVQGSPLFGRTDIKLFAAQETLAERVLRERGKDAYPYLEGVFLPQSTYPGQFFTPNNSWRFLLQASIPVFDSGRRAGQRRESEAALNISRTTLASAIVTANSEVRSARVSVDSATRALASAQAAAAQANEVVNITNISFRAGGATNIEVIDAQRQARDVENAVTLAEDTLRHAKLDLLSALGLFPR